MGAYLCSLIFCAFEGYLPHLIKVIEVPKNVVCSMETELMNRWKVDEEDMRGSRELLEDTGSTEKGPVFTPRSGFEFAKFSEEGV